MTQLYSHPFQNPSYPLPHRQSHFVITGDGFLQPLTGDKVDLNDFVAKGSPDVQLMPIHTNIMRASGLLHGGIAVINRRRKPQLGDLLAVRFNGVVIMRRLERKTGRYCFVADDPREQIYYVTPEARIERLGVITHVLNTVCTAC